jgi:preprotein translocase subunit SecA
LEGIFTLSDKDKETLSKMPVMEMEEMLRMNIRGILQTKQKKYGARIFAEAVKVLYISTLDHYFGEHLTHIDNLREGINLRGYAQLDPLNEYKKESYQIFNTMLENIRLDFFRRLVHLEVEKSEALEVLEEKPKKLVKGKVTNEEKKTPSRANNKKSIGRNDPCWCGSGKKWKKCHYPDKG